jgi:hypothetical protein
VNVRGRDVPVTWNLYVDVAAAVGLAVLIVVIDHHTTVVVVERKN